MLGLVSKKKLTECEEFWNEQCQKMEFDKKRLEGEVKNKNKIAFDLNNQVLDLKAKVEELTNTNLELGKADLQREYDITQLKLQIKQLKTLCTKNGIDYSKIVKKEK